MSLLQLIKNKTVQFSSSVDETKVRTTRRGSMYMTQGFTLVEVILVLAIIGLIFVIIFLAVTSAQKGQRDTARKDAVNRTVAVYTQLAGNNGGTFNLSIAGNQATLAAANTLPVISGTAMTYTWAGGAGTNTTVAVTATTQACTLLEAGAISYCKSF